MSPVPAEQCQPGARVAYEDMANPRREGRIVERLGGPMDQYLVQWDDGEVSTSDLRQYGWDLLADMPGSPFDGAPIISIYSRAQALEDGVLIDVSAVAREHGMKYPVAMTQAVWTDCVEWPWAMSDESHAIQDEAGRLWDVLWMLRCAVLASHGADRIEYKVLRVPSSPPGTLTAREVTLVAVCGPGDDAEPVITIMQPGED